MGCIRVCHSMGALICMVKRLQYLSQWSALQSSPLSLPTFNSCLYRHTGSWLPCMASFLYLQRHPFIARLGLTSSACPITSKWCHLCVASFFWASTVFQQCLNGLIRIAAQDGGRKLRLLEALLSMQGAGQRKAFAWFLWLIC